MKSFWLKNEKAFIRYVDTETEGQPLVLLHGLGTSAIADFSEAIADRRFAAYRCLLIDFLGFGLSDRPIGFGYNLYDHANTIANLMDHLNLKYAIIAGHSMGGTVAIALTQIRPDLVSRLIVAEPNLDPGVGNISKVIASQSEREFVETGYEKIVIDIGSHGLDNPSDAIYQGTFMIADPGSIYFSAVGLLKGTVPPQRELLAGLGIPRAYITGEQNVAEIPFEQLHKLGLTTHVVPKSGHAMMHENLEGFRVALLNAIYL